jgi:PHD/YefM family antitoxin component YafN of YafNO toxin-antitoxin module
MKLLYVARKSKKFAALLQREAFEAYSLEEGVTG